jgi:hypothetical protein
LQATPLGTHKAIRCETTHRISSPSIAWNGTEFVLAWTESKEWNYFVDPSSTVKAIRLDGALNPIDAEPFDVSPPGTVAQAPSVAADARGVTIAYSRLDPASADVTRVFMRTLDRIGARRRTTR